MGLPTEGLREPVGLLPDLFATLGPRRVPEREDLALVLLPVLLPAFALVTVPEEVKDRFFASAAIDSSNFTSFPTTKLFVVTKFIIHSGISPLFPVFCFSFFSGSEEIPNERLLGLDGEGTALS